MDAKIGTYCFFFLDDCLLSWLG